MSFHPCCGFEHECGPTIDPETCVHCPWFQAVPVDLTMLQKKFERQEFWVKVGFGVVCVIVGTLLWLGWK